MKCPLINNTVMFGVIQTMDQSRQLMRKGNSLVCCFFSADCYLFVMSFYTLDFCLAVVNWHTIRYMGPFHIT